MPCLVIRGITDSADGQAQVNYEQYRGPASENAAALTAAVLADLPD